MKKKSPQSAGGKARAAKLTGEQRSNIARAAISKRWEHVERPKVPVSAKVDPDVLEKALAKWGSNKSDLIAKLLEDYAR